MRISDCGLSGRGTGARGDEGKKPPRKTLFRPSASPRLPFNPQSEIRIPQSKAPRLSFEKRGARRSFGSESLVASVVVRAACGRGRGSGRRARRLCALRDEPEFEGVGLARAAVDEAEAVAADAARGRQISNGALAHAVGRAGAAAAARVGDDVAGRAGAVLKLDSHLVEPRLVVVERDGRELAV